MMTEAETGVSRPQAQGADRFKDRPSPGAPGGSAALCQPDVQFQNREREISVV